MKFLQCIHHVPRSRMISTTTPFTNTAASLVLTTSTLPKISLGMMLVQKQRNERMQMKGFNQRMFTTASLDSSDSHSDFQTKAREVVNPDSAAVEVIKNDITSNNVFLYMKGNPQAPRCGFSASVVRILQHLNVPFASRDVLENDQIREAVKQFSDWPTLPQLYVKGEFVGGADIIGTLFKSGELETLFRDAGVLPPIPTSSNTSSTVSASAAS